jgi:hypothetical protein
MEDTVSLSFAILTLGRSECAVAKPAQARVSRISGGACECGSGSGGRISSDIAHEKARAQFGLQMINPSANRSAHEPLHIVAVEKPRCLAAAREATAAAVSKQAQREESLTILLRYLPIR